MTGHLLAFSCPDRPGIVAAVTGLLHEQAGNITDARQYNDAATNRFFMRVAFDMAETDSLTATFGLLAKSYDMTWRLRPASRLRRVLILVSKFDHCLVDLLYRTRIGELDMDIVGVVSNHSLASIGPHELGSVPFHHIPVSQDSKTEAEAQLMEIVDDTDAELVVLARYMQILSDDLTRKLSGRCVNIHHSFLPGFKGARPYHQAYRRGVKMIGASAHFVTADLDEGPIIAQGVEPVTHADTPDTMIARGRSVEQRVLARAVKALIEDRVFLNGARTVVFE